MAETAFLLIVGDAGLRSALAARLTLAGATVMTANSLESPAVQRSRPRRTVLVIDEPGLLAKASPPPDGRDDDACWEGIVMLTAEEEPPSADGVVYARKSDAAQALEQFLPRRPDSSRT